MADTWVLGLVLNAVIALAFLGVAGSLAASLTRGRQWRANPLGSATFIIFVACGGGHAVHVLQLLYPWLGAQGATAAAAQAEYQSWHVIALDALTAAAGVSYWLMRSRFPDLVSGAAVFEDLRERERRALEIHDSIVQGLVRAQVALDIDRSEEGAAAVADTLNASNRIITSLVGEQAASAKEASAS